MSRIKRTKLRFAAYAKSLGKTSAELSAEDWDMSDYIVWLMDSWREFTEATTYTTEEEFDNWLKETAS